MTENNKIACRICLRYDKESKKCLSIFESYNGCSLFEKINSIANVNIRIGDGLPEKICPDCLLQLETAVSFKQTCEASNKILLCNILLANQTINKSQIENVTKEIIKKEFKEEQLEPQITSIQDDHSAEYTDNEDILEDCTIKPTIVKKSRIKDLQLICDDCGGSFKSKCKLGVHWKNIHQPEKLICPNCKRTFKSYKSFNKHMKRKTRNCSAAARVRIEGQGKSRIFHCKECNYKSVRAKDIDTHMVIHTGDRRFQCQDCHKSFTQQSSLQSHRECTHKDFRVDTTCHLCGKHIQGRSKFYKHMRSHNQQDVQCKVCNKVLKSKKYLSLHMLRHSGTKSYSCEICAASFFTYCEVYNHRKKVHMKSRNIKCDKCDYKMTTRTALKAHIAKHTGTNVICLVCGQFSENAEKLAIHQKRHFERNVQCTQCEKMYHNKRSLSKHMSKDHRCTMLVEKRENLSINSAIKEESPPPKKEEYVILLSPPAIVLK